MDRWMNGWMDERMNGLMYRFMDEWIENCVI